MLHIYKELPDFWIIFKLYLLYYNILAKLFAHLPYNEEKSIISQ